MILFNLIKDLKEAYSQGFKDACEIFENDTPHEEDLKKWIEEQFNKFIQTKNRK